MRLLSRVGVTGEPRSFNHELPEAAADVAVEIHPASAGQDQFVDIEASKLRVVEAQPAGEIAHLAKADASSPKTERAARHFKRARQIGVLARVDEERA